MVQHGSPLKWGVYCAMVVFGLAIIVAGMGSQGSKGWTSQYNIYILYGAPATTQLENAESI